jgi:diguanylate cyclase (GGDEF)-like protein
MSLRVRIALAVMVTVALLSLAAVGFLHRYASERAVLAEQEEVNRSLDRAVQAIKETESRLNALTADWAYWDETFMFINGASPEFPARNLVYPTVDNLGLDAISLLNLEGRIIHATHSKTSQLEPISLAAQVPWTTLTKNLAPQSAYSGVVWANGTLYVISVRAVLPNSQKGPSAGWCLMAKGLTAPAIRSLEEVAQTQIRLDLARSSAPTVVQPVAQGQVKGTRVIADAAGRPAVALSTTIPRTLYNQASAVIYLASALFVLMGIVLGVVLLFVLEKSWLVRLDRLEREVDRIGIGGGELVAVTVDGPDELGRFADRMNQLLSRIQANEQELRAHNELLEELVQERTQEIAHQAMHDKLTGLPNRTLFLKRLQDALDFRKADNLGPAVLFIDLDNFKMVNDSMGHGSGDELLTLVGNRLRSSVKSTDLVARVGGDEFLVLMPLTDNEEQAIAAAARILSLLKEPFRLAGGEVFVGASIGVALAGPPGATSDKVIRQADAAMYRAKATGKSAWWLYDSTLDEEAAEKVLLAGSLRRALENRELYPEFQPIVDLASGAIVGAEALARWLHPEMGSIPPRRFIPIAEEAGLIAQLGFQILERACVEGKCWQGACPGGFKLSVNLSGAQILREDLVTQVADILTRTEFPPQSLQLEITESILLGNEEAVLRKLNCLRVLGVSLALDDFGTGYSSLSSLSSYPLDMVKIDRSFVSRLLDDPNSRAVTAAIIALARTLNMRCTAEGIELEGQAERLSEMGCQLGQGWLYGKSMAPGSLRALLQMDAEDRAA